MTDFTLDTSGAVIDRSTDLPARPLTRWPDLSPFEQGYVEALFASGIGNSPLGVVASLRRDAFSDLAPSTLAAIRKDCAAHCASFNHTRETCLATKGDGALLWRFAGLTPTLGDDGLVYQREAGQ